MPKRIALYAVLGIALAPIASGIPEVGSSSILITPSIHLSSTASKPILCYLFPKLPQCVNK